MRCQNIFDRAKPPSQRRGWNTWPVEGSYEYRRQQQRPGRILAAVIITPVLGLLVLLLISVLP